jgi:hypothetical protein
MKSFKEIAQFCQEEAPRVRRRFRNIALMGFMSAAVWLGIAVFISRNWILSGALGFVAGAQSIFALGAWRHGEIFFRGWMQHRQDALEMSDKYSEE